MSTNFDKAFKLVVGEEGGFSKDPEDPGNWTGGKKGLGILKGTKYGISAASYPNLDIVNLTLDKAKSIYLANYWNPCGCDELSFQVALPLFDCAVNCGKNEAIILLQRALGAKQDGVMGAATKKMAEVADQDHLLVELMTAEELYKVHLNGFTRYGLGWTRRLLRMTLAAVRA